MKKVIVEKFIPYVGDAFEGVAQVVRLAPEEITPEAVSDADALLVRTRTRCNPALLHGSKVSFVGTATIGTDHLDLPYLASRGIEAVNAPGCNAPAVGQYVMAALLEVERLKGKGQSSPGASGLEGKTLGVVGCGHVGKIVEKWARGLGMKTLVSDPPRADAEGPTGFFPLEEIAQKADFITFHTPLTSQGPHPTFHLADRAFFASLRRQPVIINAARGGVVDNADLVGALDRGQASAAVIDTWEGEPNISPALLSRAAIATPHIAGYSIEGKQRATQTVVNACLRHFAALEGTMPRLLDLGVSYQIPETVTAEAVTASYPILADDALLRANPSHFEALRQTYPLRREV